jgi:hypothetical protein
MRRLRPRIGLRLLLLLVTLFCVLTAYLRASLDLQRENNWTRLGELEHRQWYLEIIVGSGDLSVPQAKSELASVNAELNGIRKQLGHPKK